MTENAENQPLKEEKEEITIEFCNSRSRLQKNDEEESTTFFFDYSTPDSDGECINWVKLRDLKVGKKWGVIRHPFILNYLNEKLVSCGLLYTGHILAFFAFLVLLTSHVFTPSLFKNWIITIFVAGFGFFMLLKGAIKGLVTKSISFWFVVSYVFNLLTYLATLAYVWFPTFSRYDDYHEEHKKIISWFLPIIAIISAWANSLYILRKSPFGIYIFMMVRILRSFGHIATIWIPTLLAFSFAFHLIMKDTGIKPWDLVDDTANVTMVHKLLIILQAVTKTSTMMIGEVDANDILDTNQWIPSILVLIFEIITVILLMNLMVSLAVGDVSDLKNSAQDKLLKIKLNFVIESLQLSEQFEGIYSTLSIHNEKTRNVLVVEDDGEYLTGLETNFPRSLGTEPTKDESFKINFPTTDMRLRIRTVRGERKALLRNCVIECVESPESGIPVLVDHKETSCERPSWLEQYKRWIIGLDWKAYLDL